MLVLKIDYLHEGFLNTKMETKVSGMIGYKKEYDCGIMERTGVNAKKKEIEEFSWLFKG